MREFIREIFAGVYAPFTGRILASVAVLPVLFSMSVGVNQTSSLMNIVDESAIVTVEEEVTTDEEIEVREPDAGNTSTSQSVGTSQARQVTPVDIAASAPVSYELVVSGKIATNVENGNGAGGEIFVPNSSAGLYSSGNTPMLVGHNTGVFANLKYVNIGEIIEFRGVSYRVVNKKTYEYDPNLQNYAEDNVTLTDNGKMMMDSLYGGYDLSLMTCAGTYSNGVWNQRLVVFANKV